VVVARLHRLDREAHRKLMEPYLERRARVLERIHGVLVVLSMPVAYRNADVEHEYRQDSDLYYLSGFAEPDSVLVLSNVHPEHRFVLFVRPRDPEREIWDGPRAGVDGAVSHYGADAAFPIGELAERLPAYLAADRLYFRLGRDRDGDDKVLAAVARARGRGRTPSLWPTEIVDPATVLHELRLRKSRDEVARMRRAAEITRDAHVGAMNIAAPGRWEYELEAVIRETFRRNGAERPAYAPIVGSGPNSTILHYRTNNRRLEDGDLVLIDAGCEYDYYASDVTRTFPVSGTFSRPQRVIYDAVLEAQAAAIAAVQPGATLEGVHDVAVRTVVARLLTAGLLTGDAEKILAEHTYRRFFMHKTSHWLGMDVHDVGGYFQAGQPRALEPGMVLTVEPGIYVRDDDAEAPPEYRGIGVRIEDDVLVTESGRRELTADIPRDPGDVERACGG
jgi:Xaa-Pro aminopeptidase